MWLTRLDILIKHIQLKVENVYYGVGEIINISLFKAVQQMWLMENQQYLIFFTHILASIFVNN